MRLTDPNKTKEALKEKRASFTYEQVSETQRRATRVLELLTGTPIRRRELEEEYVLAGETKVLLGTFPVEDVKISGIPVDYDPRLGIVTASTAASNYRITYTVGYREAEIPAIVVSAIDNLTKLKLTGQEDEEGKLQAEIAVLRLEHIRKRRERQR